MSQTINAVDEDGNIQYVLNDSSGFILQSSDSDQFSNLICTDGTQAFFLDGALIADSSDENGQTYVLQDDGDLSQYYIQETDGIFVSEEKESPATGLLEAVTSVTGDDDCSSQSQLIQFIDDEGNLINAQIASILCLQDETETTGEYQLVEDYQAGIDGMQTLQLETSQMVELKDLIQQQEESSVQIEDENRYQYVILEDGKLHIQSYAEYEASNEINQVATKPAPVEWENITGRNLITGKQLSLRSLAENPQKISPKRKRKKKGGLEVLLNKKLNLGRTVDGKKLVGKIIHVGKRKQEGDAAIEAVKEDVNQENAHTEDTRDGLTDSLSFEDSYASQATFVQAKHSLDIKDDVIDSSGFKDTNVVQAISSKRVSTTSDIQYILKRKIICKDVLEQISKILSGLMKLDSVNKRFRNKYLLIKAIARRYVQSKKRFEKDFSYSSGYMVETYSVNQETGDLTESWSYVHDDRINSEESSDAEAPKNVMFEDLLQLTLLITLQKNRQHVKVMMEPDGSPFRCDACDKTFRTKMLLNLHLSTMHDISLHIKQCEHCPFASASDAEYEDHRKYHDGQQVLGCVEEGCEASFSTLEKLSIHAEVHRKDNNKCSSSPAGSDDNNKDVSKNQLTSHGIENTTFLTIEEKDANDKNREAKTKIYTCDICQHTFSRSFNLMRHVLIHVGKPMYSCSICGSAYHYVSSLTKHMVRNHVKV
ncbi:unnamed protein product [Callosobruchus maculatus]|uniref:C2H2-type domain-containing protein n=1 Tax=Callosobruchus maculatus TaxID=64391 RepID=A0A653DPB8_CALMS|nr:unnamed protein product [Callosobruchus maculatus]